ncbi:MAG: hypothetical protein GKR99_02440 [Rhodobacteraceae bacterium]|nr:hypothetical protein [Paracoccaceae bacterium]
MSALQSIDFAQVWLRFFGETPPLAHVLRHDFFECWTRFHALPEAKRYADTDDERAIVLCRANKLATACFGERTRIWVATGHFTDLPAEDDDITVRMNITKAMTWVDCSDREEDQSEMTFFAVAFDWKPHALDNLFVEIANFQERAILFSQETRTVLAPYDGGFDIISLRPGLIGALESDYRAWMSTRPDRL